ncbi:hypothetical protein PIB30_088044 [Stylosanthes scabra]|uniref:Uncharacterized protein n=1 Tax=Stylosanthes scabra TaxID=79078 RepID=A0ABU6VSA1_9FABA|nr:hypothetical protein [Stylosanthes scabra]
MASSSRAARKRRGKAIAHEEDEFDALRFKSPFHQNFYNTNVASKPIIPDTTFNLEEGQYPHIQQQTELRGWKRLNKPKKRISQAIIREFYTNARIDPDRPLNTEMSYRTRMIEGNQELDTVIKDLCIEGSIWSLGARNNPLYLKRSDLNPIARAKRFGLRNHSDAIMNIITKLHATKPPLAFPNIIARLCEEMDVPYLASRPVEAVPKARPMTTTVMENLRYPPVQPYFQQEQPANAANMPQGYGWDQLQEDMANLNKNQTQFYENMLAQQAAYGLRLQDLERRQKDMWVEQQQFHQDVRSYQALQKEQFQLFQEEQEKMHRELMNHRKNFSTHMGKVHTAQEENKAKLNQINQVVLSHSLDSQSGNMYTHFGLQQGFPSLVPITPSKIPGVIRNNFREGKPLFEGMLSPWPPEGSTSATGQQDPPAVDVPRD